MCTFSATFSPSPRPADRGNPRRHSNLRDPLGRVGCGVRRRGGVRVFGATAVPPLVLGNRPSRHERPTQPAGQKDAPPRRGADGHRLHRVAIPAPPGHTSTPTQPHDGGSSLPGSRAWSARGAGLAAVRWCRRAGSGLGPPPLRPGCDTATPCPANRCRPWCTLGNAVRSGRACVRRAAAPTVPASRPARSRTVLVAAAHPLPPPPQTCSKMVSSTPSSDFHWHIRPGESPFGDDTRTFVGGTYARHAYSLMRDIRM
jgi:hypothetical protein